VAIRGGLARPGGHASGEGISRLSVVPSLYAGQDHGGDQGNDTLTWDSSPHRIDASIYNAMHMEFWR